MPSTSDNDRYRELGRSRLEICSKAKTQEDWARLWKEPQHAFPFKWGECWKSTIEYKVTDFAAEVGFFIDALSLPINALGTDYAMFTSPNRDFFFSVVPAKEGESTPPDTMAIEFMVEDVFDAYTALKLRRIEMENEPRRHSPGSSLFVCSFRTPNGIEIRLWSVTENPPADEKGSCCINV